MRTLAIDYGNTRIGLALSNENNTLASHLTVIRNTNTKHVLQKLSIIIAKDSIATIVMGIPLNDDLTKTSMAHTIEIFVKELERFLKEIGKDTSIILVNEAMTSYQAYENLLEKNYTHEKIKTLLDMESARILLQEYLDSNGKE